eukprot:1448044-Pyramimonas_sp.AAC.1
MPGSAERAAPPGAPGPGPQVGPQDPKEPKKPKKPRGGRAHGPTGHRPNGTPVWRDPLWHCLR